MGCDLGKSFVIPPWCLHRPLAPVLIGVLQKNTINQYMKCAKEPDAPGPALWQGMWAALLFFCSANPLSVWKKDDIPNTVCMFSAGATFCSFAQYASSPLSAPVFGSTAS